jgi:hypothetical protein
MASRNYIVIKHGEGAPADGSLIANELGFDTTNSKLYIGKASAPVETTDTTYQSSKTYYLKTGDYTYTKFTGTSFDSSTKYYEINFTSYEVAGDSFLNKNSTDLQEIKGNVKVDNTLSTKTMVVDENESIGGILGVTGNASIGGTLGIAGDTTVGGAFSSDGTLTVPNAVVSGTVSTKTMVVNENESVGGWLNVAGSVIASRLTVYGKTLIDLIYPVGSIYMSTVYGNPGNWLTGTTWVSISDRFLLGAGDVYGAGTTGGSSTRSLSASNLPPYVPISWFNASSPSAGAYGSLDGNIIWSSKAPSGYVNVDTGQTASAFSIMPPYLVVYMWKRTA